MDLFSGWDRLSNEFRRLKEAGDLSGVRSRERKAPIQWGLQDASDDLIAEFDNLATQAGELLGRSGDLSYRDTWLEALRSQIRRWEKRPEHRPANNHGSLHTVSRNRGRVQIVSRLFQRLTSASAKYCNKLARESIEAGRASEPASTIAPGSSETMLTQDERVRILNGEYLNLHIEKAYPLPMSRNGFAARLDVVFEEAFQSTSNYTQKAELIDKFEVYYSEYRRYSCGFRWNALPVVMRSGRVAAMD